MHENTWEIRWTERADRDLGRAILYLEERRPRAADRWKREFLRRVSLLQDQPEMGVCVDIDGEPSLYRRIVSGDYALYYRLVFEEHTVMILRVWHSSRNPVDLMME